MEDSYIQNALMQYLYRELPAEEVAEWTELIAITPEMRILHRQFVGAKSFLPKATFSPSSACLNTILRYSAQTAVSAHS
jgi:hypothetical protein